ncbi:MAG: hypothetical protein JST20_03955 [Bacteroidetes bacterium]|nr:hypothetical protein [Bacteroidota bacterium]
MHNSKASQGDSRNKCAVLVVSCDNYADVWEPFFELFRRFWGNCPYSVYLLTNHLKPNIENVSVINVGDDISWSDNLSKALHSIEEEFVFLFLEDLLLENTVNTTEVENMFDWAVSNNVNYLRLNPSTKPDLQYNDYVGIVSKGTIYRASVVVCLWKKEILLNLLKTGENAWEFEKYGSIRSDVYDKFYSTYKNNFPIVNSIIKRVWETSAVKKMITLNISIDYSKRRKMTFTESIIWKFKLLRSLMFSLVPANLRRSIKSLIQREN